MMNALAFFYVPELERPPEVGAAAPPENPPPESRVTQSNPQAIAEAIAPLIERGQRVVVLNEQSYDRLCQERERAERLERVVSILLENR